MYQLVMYLWIMYLWVIYLGIYQTEMYQWVGDWVGGGTSMALQRNDWVTGCLRDRVAKYLGGCAKGYFAGQTTGSG